MRPTVLYASGEESAAQLHLRAGRLGLVGGAAGDGSRCSAATEVEAVLAARRAARPALLIVDSVQTLTRDGLEGPAGSVGQVREAAARLGALAPQQGVPVILVGHVTKDGSLAGPRTLEHLVDVVLMLEGDRYGSLRLLRAAKNRFGSTEEVGVLEMTGRGAARGGRPGARLPRRGGPRGSRRARSRPSSRARGRCSWRCRPWSRRPGIGAPRRTVAGVDGSRLALLRGGARPARAAWTSRGRDI